MAFTFHGIAIGLRDLGMTMNPQGAHYTLMGIETLGLRMPKHVENAQKIAEWLENDPRVTRSAIAGWRLRPAARLPGASIPRGGGAVHLLVEGGMMRR